MAEPTSNEAFLDALVRHQVGLMRVSSHIRRKIVELLDATERSLRDEIERRVAKGLPADNMTSRRLRLLEEAIAKIRLGAWGQITQTWLNELDEIAKAEPEFVRTAAKAVSPTVLELTLPAPELLRSLVRSRPFEGRVLRKWARDIAAADIRRLTDAVRIGVVQGETGAQIARRVVGTVRLRGVDGVVEITRRQAVALTRTAVNHVSNAARQEFHRENKAVFENELFVATLDAATTPVCRAEDGNLYPLGVGPMPPLHFQCRSLRVAILDDDVIGRRPMKPVTERQLAEEYSDGRASSRDALPRGERGAFDEFARKRTRQLVGTVPAKTTYQQFLRRQSAAFQDDVLGRTRGRLFRGGGLTLDKFINRVGDEIPLNQLVKIERQAFIDAGFDPSTF